MSDDPHAGIRAGGSADPDEAGPGTGVAGAATKLTGAAQIAANTALDGIEEVGNSIFDAGEGGLQGALKVVDALQTGVSNATTVLTAKVTGQEVGELPTIPTAEVAAGLTGGAQDAANKALTGLQQFANEAFDIGEEALADALKVVDAAQQRVATLFSTITGLIEGQVGPAKG